MAAPLDANYTKPSSATHGDTHRETDDPGNIVISRSILDLWVPLVGLFGSIVLIDYLAEVIPYSVRSIDLDLGETSFSLDLPILGIVPLVLFARILRGIFNEKYILTPDYILAITGRISLNTRSIRLRYAHIKDVEVNKSFHQYFFDVADLYFSTSIRHDDDTIHLKGIRHPDRIKDLIQERITQALLAARGQSTSPQDMNGI